MTDERMVLVLLGYGANDVVANDAVRGIMLQMGSALEALGIPVMNISLEPSELQFAVDEMSKGNVRFGLAWLGVGQEMSGEFGVERRVQNCWEAFDVPLVKVHADSPAYFSDRHRDTPRNSANLYMAQEFAHFRRRWMPGARSISAVIPPWAMSPIDRGDVNVKLRKRGTLVFLKNGNAPASLRGLWNSRLSRHVAGALNEMAEEAAGVGFRAGTLHLGDLVGRYLAGRSIEPDTVIDVIPFLTAQLDDYLRRLKSEMIAKALLELPVIVQGDHWEHVDFSRARARLVPGQSYEASRRVFTDELGVIDMSPNMDSEPHERVMRAAGSYAAVLTNEQSWLNQGLSQFSELTFAFSPAAIAARVADALDRRDYYIDLAIEFGETFRAKYPRDLFARRVLEVAELAELQYSRQKPEIQSFFTWPTGSRAHEL